MNENEWPFTRMWFESFFSWRKKKNRNIWNEWWNEKESKFIYLFFSFTTFMDGRFIRTADSYFENRTIVVVDNLQGYRNRHCSKSTIDGIVRTVKWWIAVGVKSWRELVLTETRIRTIRAKSDSCRRNSVLSSRLMVSEFWNAIDKIVYNRTSVKSTKLLRCTRLKLQFIFSN